MNEDELILIVGEAPNRSGAAAYDTRSGRRMRELMGREVPWVNLYGAAPRPWDRRDAQARARALIFDVRYASTVLLLGARVRDAFGMKSRPMFEFQPVTFHLRAGDETHDVEWFRVAWMPHPSGSSRFWNDKKAAGRAARFLKEVANDG